MMQASCTSIDHSENQLKRLSRFRKSSALPRPRLRRTFLELRAIRDDESLHVTIITGAGPKFFCPGWDMKTSMCSTAARIISKVPRRSPKSAIQYGGGK